MTRDEIIWQNEVLDMARQAGAIPIHKKPKDVALVGIEIIEAFAKLVDAKATARVRKETLEEMIYAHPTTAIKQAVEYEREACAKECEQTAVRMGSEWMAHHCAAAIRNRGEAT